MKVVLNIEEPIRVIKEAKRSSKYETIRYKLITKNGKSIYSTEKGFFGNMTEAPDNRLCKECQDKHGGHFVIKSDIPGEENLLCAYAYSQGLRDFESLGWILILKLHARELFAPVEKLVKQLITISIIITVVAVLIGVYITSNISTPLLKLRDAAIEIGKGNLDVRIDTNSNDEIGQLAASFKKMVEDLGNTTTSIDKLADEMVERKKAQEALARKRRLLRTLMDTLPDQIFAKDINGTFIFSNINCARNLGVESPKDVVGKTDFDFFSREQAEQHRAKELQIMQTGQLLSQEEQVHNKVDDTTKWFSISKVLWRDDDGNAIGIVGISSDITDRKQMEQALENEKNSVRNYLDAAEVIILVLDADQKVKLINRKGCEVLGHREKDIIGKDWCDNFVPEQDRDEVRLVLSKLLSEKNKTPHYYENPVLTEGRQVRLAAWRNIILHDDKEGVAALLSSGEDITERKEAENQLMLTYQELEDANGELKEMQSQLVQNEKLASIGQLAAGVAHEMNTPVGFVASNFQTLESYVKKFKSIIDMYEGLLGQIETLEKKEIRKKTDEIRGAWDDMKMDFILKDIQQVFKESEEGIDRVTSIIKNLKDFSRIDQAEEFDEYDLNSGINSTLVIARNEIKYDADLKTDFTELPHIFCHAGQINQVFLNVILNAAQAIKAQEREGKGIVTIKTYATETDVVCEICDDGPGIAPDKLSKIFDPFFTTKPAGKGTGLGLSVSHDIIVNKHKGELLVDSTVGEGTTFTIKLPIKTSKQNTERETVHSGNQNSTIC
jgi:PAS domain S-box-containing protein